MSRISIPAGQIEGPEWYFNDYTRPEFQYQQVRLKDMIDDLAEAAKGEFQYQQVRLKVGLRDRYAGIPRKFQYQQVRLKAAASYCIFQLANRFQYQQVRLKVFNSGVYTHEQVDFNTSRSD